MDNPTVLPITILDWHMERVGELIVDKYWNTLDVREEFDTQWNARECPRARTVYMRHVEAIHKEVMTRGPSAGITFQRRFTSILGTR